MASADSHRLERLLSSRTARLDFGLPLGTLLRKWLRRRIEEGVNPPCLREREEDTGEETALWLRRMAPKPAECEDVWHVSAFDQDAEGAMAL